jgi:DNA-3-methyladenine glycosylase
MRAGSKIITASFFDRSALKVARDLIGCSLHSKLTNQPQCFVITETEAYLGAHDLASHASRGRTKWNEALFGPPATLYIYFVYGIHWMLNVVTGPVDCPAAVLIRCVEGIEGPARVAKSMGITGGLNGKKAAVRTGVWFSEGMKPLTRRIKRSPRIGVDYAGPIWSQKRYRFSLMP